MMPIYPSPMIDTAWNSFYEALINHLAPDIILSFVPFNLGIVLKTSALKAMEEKRI